ncbi:DUF6662 family protein [Variovorax ginsengisoli]|uniref:Lipoprotein n=1 Tax=Variovorax ginsengisoli TaxID=363844 RepID=A0ABT9S5M4_9BURK|nr:DUF6662 family protein [Variovorax ginsengisoli]MDP9899041.1 hypothetical protein [Variovorax ginsengisoli]
MKLPTTRWPARFLAVTGLTLACSWACAGEGAFGWVYTLDLQPKGKAELEQKVDVTHGQATGSYDLGQYRTELEYGVTDDVQLGAYVNAFSIYAKNNYLSSEVCTTIPCTAGFGVPSTANNSSAYRRSGIDGTSLEAIWRLLNPVTSPVGIGLYVEPTWGKLEDELEFRIIAQSNFLDDRLIFAANLLVELEKEKYDPVGGIIRNSMADLLYGVSYRFAPKWSAGVEGRFHTDHDGYHFNQHTQTANFIGPNVHYAEKDWWVTAAWRHQVGGKCYADGTADCSLGQVWDNHGRNQIMLKVGFLLN